MGPTIELLKTLQVLEEKEFLALAPNGPKDQDPWSLLGPHKLNRKAPCWFADFLELKGPYKGDHGE